MKVNYLFILILFLDDNDEAEMIEREEEAAEKKKYHKRCKEKCSNLPEIKEHEG